MNRNLWHDCYSPFIEKYIASSVANQITAFASMILLNKISVQVS